MGCREQFFPFFAVVVCVTCVDARAAEGEDFFEKKIRPLLVEHCYECHGPEKQENKLRLDKAAELFAGGKSGSVITPGKPDGSLLITAVRYTNDELQMPPEKKLSAEQIADLVKWVELGAPHPERDATSASPAIAEKNAAWQKREEHWAFKAPVAISPPPFGNGWSQTSIDPFIAAKLREAKLESAAPADRRTLIRRVTFDLLGLPPSPDEVDAFLQDESPDAFAKVADRLLASPEYGKRWGRHWLDVARYADSNGLDENIAHGNAWRYRDWVIDAFNRDLSFGDFLRYQVAGDLLPSDDAEERNRRLIATGFLALGPKVLAEVDQQKMEMDIIDEQIDTLGRSLLGLTLGCARCHDHKFDPITTKDYYALAGIFKSTHTMDSLVKIAKWYEHPLQSAEHERAVAEHRQQVEAKKVTLKDAIAAATSELQASLAADVKLPEKPEESFPQATKEMLKQLRDEIAALEKKAPVAPSAMGVREEKPIDVAVHIRGSHLTKGDVVPRGIPVVLNREEPVSITQSSGRLALADWLAQPENPLAARVMVNRVWRWHFGRGLVDTPDNFGLLGSQPSHPELLDHLAVEFAADGSLKNLHRRLLLSATYQTGSECSPVAKEVDPENRLLGRTTIRRLEAEEIRDSILAVSSMLDPKSGGPALAVANRAHIFDHTSKDETTYGQNSRTVYLPVVRNHLHEVFTLFDYNDASVSSGNRVTSTVVSQTLYLLNGDFAETSAKSLAKDLLDRKELSDGERIHSLYQRAYGRPANDTETSRAIAFLERITQPTSREQAWQLLCHSILISNEFLYLR